MKKETSNNTYALVISIVTFNSERFIRRCIESISPLSDIKFSFKIVVFDNNSEDGTLELLENIKKFNPQLDIYQSDKNLGFGAAHNRITSLYKADYFLFLNPDTFFIDINTINDSLNSLITNSSYAIISTPLVYEDGSPQTYMFNFSSPIRWLIKILNITKIADQIIKLKLISKLLLSFKFSRNYTLSRLEGKITIHNHQKNTYSNNELTVDWVSGAAMFIKYDFFKKCGGFDTDMFLYGEDEDLCIKAKKMDYCVAAIKTAPVAHGLGWESSQYNAKIAEYKFNSLKIFINKNIKGKFNKKIMLFMLPMYVYGLKKILKKHIGFWSS